MRFYGKIVDKIFGVVLVALFSSLLLLGGSLVISVNDQVKYDEAVLKAGTLLQQQTFYVFDRGAVWGYKLAHKQMIPAIGQLIKDAIKHHDMVRVRKYKPQHRRVK